MYCKAGVLLLLLVVGLCATASSKLVPSRTTSMTELVRQIVEEFDESVPPPPSTVMVNDGVRPTSLLDTVIVQHIITVVLRIITVIQRIML